MRSWESIRGLRYKPCPEFPKILTDVLTYNLQRTKHQINFTDTYDEIFKRLDNELELAAFRRTDRLVLAGEA